MTSEVCDLPTNILLIRLLDALKRNPKFVPRNTRSHRSNSRPAFRIAKEIFFQSASRPPILPQVTTSTSHVRRSTDSSNCRSFVYPADQRPLNFPLSSSNRATRSDSAPCPAVQNASANCYAVPSRRKEQSTNHRAPRVVPQAEAPPVAGPRATSALHVNPDMVNSSMNLPALNQGPLVTSSPFCRSSSHDYLAGVQQMAWNGVAVVPSSARTKSLSRPSSRKSEKHATLPPRITISPNQLQTFARSMSHGLSESIRMETPKSLFSNSMTIGNPLYGFTTERRSVDQRKNGMTVKPAIHFNETGLRALDPMFVSVTGRRVKALYSCVGETVNELSFDADAIITDGEYPCSGDESPHVRILSLVLESGEDGWLIGTYRGRRGLVPLNYVQHLPPQTTD